MRLKLEKTRDHYLLRCWSSDYRQGEIAYATLGLQGPRLEIEFPSDWHEHKRAWVTIGLGLVKVAFSFPWRKTVPDQGQCSGPTYGFYFFDDHLVLQYGKTTGRRGDPQKFIYMPWSWTHVRHDYLNPDGTLHHRSSPGEYSAPEETKRVYSYRYKLHNGTIQQRIATVNGEEREWRWLWFSKLPWPSKISRTINVEFNEEVGERTGSWKGGVLGCGWEWKHGDSLEESLLQMERERKFT
jgi:hypothetical protein